MGDIHKVGPYVLGKTVGSGSTGKVKVGFHRETGEKVAVKIVNKEFLEFRPSMRKKVEREIAVMKFLEHPNVLRLYDVYETSDFLFLVVEYVEGGELFDYLVQKGSLEPAEALRFFQQIIEAVFYCHCHLICHRDLKPENLLIDTNKNIKIADFGMAALMKRDELLETSCGSPHYASPEVVSGCRYDGAMADVWSCGVILYALLSGKLPFDDDNIRKLLSKVKSGVFSMPQHIHEDLKDLISKMLTVEPSQRITLDKVRSHDWYLSKDFINRSFPEVDPVDHLVKNAQPLSSVEDIDDDILRSLTCMGWGDEQELQITLTSQTPNLEQVFYQILSTRKDTSLADEAGSSPPRGSKSVDGGGKKGRRKKKGHKGGGSGSGGSGVGVGGGTSVEDFDVDVPMLLGASDENSDPDNLSARGSDKEKKVSRFQRVNLSGRSRPRRIFLPKILGKSDKKKSAHMVYSWAGPGGFGMHSKKELSEVTAELKRSLDAMDISFSFAKHRHRVHAKFSSKFPSEPTIRFTISITQSLDDGGNDVTNFISFERKSGDKRIWKELCNRLQQEIDL